MGQLECLNVMTKEWMSTKEIAKLQDQPVPSVSRSLKLLHRHNEIERKEITTLGYLKYVWRLK